MGTWTSSEFYISNCEKFSLCSAVICVYIDMLHKNVAQVWLFPYCKCMSILDATCPWKHLCGCSFGSLFSLDQFFVVWGRKEMYPQIWTIIFCWHYIFADVRIWILPQPLAELSWQLFPEGRCTSASMCPCFPSVTCTNSLQRGTMCVFSTSHLHTLILMF